MAVLPKYNIAACPVNDIINQTYFDLAKPFKGISEGYCLEADKALPHVTICQFRSENDEAAIELVREYIALELELVPCGLYANPHTDAENLWVGFIVNRDNALLDTQSLIIKKLQQHSTEILSEFGNAYFPHFTLARIQRRKAKLDDTLFKSDLLNKPCLCRLRLGLSDENGQFLKTIA